MKVLITGINGFVGSYLSELLLKEGHDVWGTKILAEITNKYLDSRVIIKDLDIREINEVENIIKSINPDCIFHLAAQSSVASSWKEPQLTLDINAIGTVNILEAVKNHHNSTKVVIIGSSEQYGKVVNENEPIVEEIGCNPQNPYALSKTMQETIAKFYCEVYKLNIVMTRSFNHIGPRQSSRFVLADFAKQVVDIENKRQDPIIKVGHLDIYRDFTDVRDVVNAYYLLMKSGKSGEIYNVCSGKTYKIEDLLNSVIRLSKVQDIKVVLDKEKCRFIDIKTSYGSNRKLCEDVNWKQYFDIERSIIDILNFWREQNELL